MRQQLRQIALLERWQPARCRPLLNLILESDNLVGMTRSSDPQHPESTKLRLSLRRPGHWPLQDAKARFSELVRLVRSEGPQHVTVHGRDEVVVVAADEFRRLKGEGTGQELIDALQASPHRDTEIAAVRLPMPVRDVSL